MKTFSPRKKKRLLVTLGIEKAIIRFEIEQIWIHDQGYAKLDDLLKELAIVHIVTANLIKDRIDIIPLALQVKYYI